MYFFVGSIAATQVLNHYHKLAFGSYVATALIIYAVVILSVFGIWESVLWPRFLSPLRKVKGPDTHWFWGNFRELFREPVGARHLQWQKQFPGEPFIRYNGLFHWERLLVNTQAAHQHILTNCYDFPKPSGISQALKNILGAKGILFAEGNVHKRQRKQMNPSFSYANLKSMKPIFWSKAMKMVDAWSQMLEVSSEIEVIAGLSAATLDIIGSAGFGYEFNSIDALNDPTQENKLAAAYADLFKMKKGARVLAILTLYFPWVRSLPFPRHRELDADIAMVKKMSDEIVAAKVAKRNSGEDLGNDIFALLLRDNKRKEMEADANDPPMTNREIGDQTMTLLAAGHETTSAATSWALLALAKDPSIQTKLREELSAAIVTDEEPSFEKIESLHYLNNVTKEVLRYYPPVPITRRTAIRTTTVEGVLIPKGTDIFIVPIAINRNPAIWGPDSEVFNPDRWDSLPPTHNNYGMETFLHGARGCIGQRFAIVEMKCLLAAIILHYSFEPKPGHVVEIQSNITMRPRGGLPLIVSRV